MRSPCHASYRPHREIPSQAVHARSGRGRTWGSRALFAGRVQASTPTSLKRACSRLSTDWGLTPVQPCQSRVACHWRMSSEGDKGKTFLMVVCRYPSYLNSRKLTAWMTELSVGRRIRRFPFVTQLISAMDCAPRSGIYVRMINVLDTLGRA